MSGKGKSKKKKSDDGLSFIQSKHDIYNIGGDSKQCEVLSKLSKKITRQAKKSYKT